MSSAKRVAFVSKRKPTKTTAVTAGGKLSAKKPPLPAAAGVEGESELREMVKQFKKSCESQAFRNDKANYAHTVRILAAAKKFSLVENVLEHQKKYVDNRSEDFAARLILLYGQAGMFDNARKVFDEMPRLNCPRKIASFNALLNAGCDCKKFDAVIAAFDEIPRRISVEPDAASYNFAIRALCKKGDLDHALSTFHLSVKKRKEPDLITFNTLLNALYEAGRFSEGESVFDVMKSKNVFPNVVTYNAKLLEIFNENGKISADELVSEMESRGLKPTLFTYNSLIKGFCGRGDLKEAMKWCDELHASACAPNLTTYTMIIPVCLDKGDLSTAFELCSQAIRRRFFLKAGQLRQVVDGLVAKKKIKEASGLVELINSSNYLNYKLEAPIV